MKDILTGEEIATLYKMVQIKGGKRIDKFQTTDIKRALRFHRWYVKRFHEGLLMEILPQKNFGCQYDFRLILLFHVFFHKTLDNDCALGAAGCSLFPPPSSPSDAEEKESRISESGVEIRNKWQ